MRLPFLMRHEQTGLRTNHDVVLQGSLPITLTCPTGLEKKSVEASLMMMRATSYSPYRADSPFRRYADGKILLRKRNAGKT
jgi:hypothetical protein